MGIERRSITPGNESLAPKRKLKNYLLDSRFQLKYTGMVVLVTMAVASVLGFVAYDYSRGQTRALHVQLAMQPDLDPQVAASLEELSRAEDQKVALAILGGVLILGVSLALTGIVVTHRVVGPAFKIRLLLRSVSRGHLKVDGAIRRSDELQDVFRAFNDMVANLRMRQSEEVRLLDDALDRAQKAGTPDDILRIFREVRDRMQAELE